MGGAANEDKKGANNAVIVEIDCKNTDDTHSRATVLMASVLILPLAEVLVNYGEDPEGLWTHRRQARPPGNGGQGR